MNKKEDKRWLNSRLIRDIEEKARGKEIQHILPLLAAIVTFFTFAYLILPAIALTQKQELLDCHYEIHQHTDACYAEVKDEDGTTHTELVCGKADYVIHTHTDECYSTDDTGNTYLVCTLPERTAHVHDEDCYKEEQVLVCDKEESEDHTHDESCYRTEKVLVCDQPELHTHTKACYDKDGTLVCGKLELKEHKHDKECMKSVKVAADADPAEDTEATSETEDPSMPSETLPVTDPAEDSETEAASEETAMPANTFRASVNGITVIVTAEEDTFPAGTEMQVDPVEDSRMIDKVTDAVEGKVKEVCALDISFYYQGKEIEPQKPVQVAFEADHVPEGKNIETSVVHVDDKGKTEVIDHEENDKKDTLAFEADAFSVYAVVYTVDFVYEIGGETYTLSLKGGDSISVSELAGKLGMVEDDPEELTAFNSSIETVAFSDENLVKPVQFEKNTTIGKVKTELELFPTYPLGLSQKDVLALNDKEYKKDEWVLISLKAFDTQEILTITMTNGEKIQIQVTDAQDAPMNGDTVQTIPNPAGTTIDLFDYWVVSQDLAGRDGWGDLDQNWGWPDGRTDQDGPNGTGNNKGINSRTDDPDHGHALKFSPAWEGTVYNGTKVTDESWTNDEWTSLNHNGRNGLNSYTGNGNPFQGIVQGTLSNGYPVLTNNSTIGSNGESLSYLFNPKEEHAGKASYPGTNQLLYVDKQGYYTYDSRDYAASYNNESNTFTVTEQTSNNSEIRGFWPFGTQNFWTGMHLNTQFSMPASGKVLNPVGEYKDMQFEFSGDDDTWLYVDGVLVGDGGGIHNRTEIDINFAKGTVTVTGKKDTAHEGDFEETKFLDDIFIAAGKYNEADWEDIGDGSGHKRFKAGTYHTFDMFYLERGGGESNLYIHYNLVSTADFTGHKSYYGADEDDRLMRDKFKFELTGLDGKCFYSDSTLVPGTDSEAVNARAIMPDTQSASSSNPGTIAEPFFDGNTTYTFSDGSTVGSQTYITSVTEDGNINFGFAQIPELDMNAADNGNPPTYRYVIREIVPDDAVNGDGIRWDQATPEQRAAGGFLKDEIQYDGTVFYMTATVTSWQETSANGETVIRHGLQKKYYTDDAFTTPMDDTAFVHFDNRHVPPTGNVDFDKTNEAGSAVPGAKFAFYRNPDCTVPATDMETPGRPPITATSDENGRVSFENIRVGTYYMKETEAPSPYALDETVYKVVIEDAKDSNKESKITIYGDETEKEVAEIVNTEPGKLTVVKKWLDSAGHEINDGDLNVTVGLRRRHMVAHTLSQSHTVTVQMTAEDGGVQEGPPVTQTVDGDTVVIEWDDEWQRNFNWELTVGEKHYEGWIGDEYVETENYTFEQISNEGRSRRLTIRNVDGDISLKTKYWVNWLHSDSNHWSNLNNPVITGSDPEISYTAEEDDVFNNGHTQELCADSWTHTWTLGGTESDHNGFDYPMTDDNGKKYLYYIVELDVDGDPVEIGGSPLDGFVLVGYSANNNLGVSGQGKITVYNQKEGPASISVDIKKTDDAPNSTNYLSNAVFALEYREDSSDTWINASSVTGMTVEHLDENSRFTVPKAGITLSGLINGQYRLKEINPPQGYVITEPYPIMFTVLNGAISEMETIDGVRYSQTTGEQPAEFIIPNTPGASLPHTGGTGTILFTLLGSLLILGAGVLLWRRKLI